jgi:hypothetical protein
MSLKVSDFLDLEAEESQEDRKSNSKIEDNSEDENLNQNLEDLIDDNQTDSSLRELRLKFLNDKIYNDEKNIKKVVNAKFKKTRKWTEVEKEYQEELGEENRIDKSKNQGIDYFQNEKRKKVKTKLIRDKNCNIKMNQENKIIGFSHSFNENSFTNLIGEENKKTENVSKDSKFDEHQLEFELELKRKISEKASNHKRKLKDRLKENETIMSNVIDLNKNISQEFKNKNSVHLSFSQNSQNSMLKAIKKDKNTLKFSDSQTDEQSRSERQKVKIFQVFQNRKNTALDSERRKKISAIFNKSDKNQIIKTKEN